MGAGLVEVMPALKVYSNARFRCSKLNSCVEYVSVALTINFSNFGSRCCVDFNIFTRNACCADFQQQVCCRTTKWSLS